MTTSSPPSPASALGDASSSRDTAPGSLAELQRDLHAALRGDRTVRAVAAELGLPAARLELYRRFLRGHIVGVLAKDFPLVRASLPTETWDGLVDSFYRAHPAESVELNRAAEAFPAFLEAADAARWPGLTPSHASLAAFEWAEFVTYTHEGRVPAHGEVTEPTLNPTLSVVSLPVPVLEYVVEGLEAGDGAPRAGINPPPPKAASGDGPELVLFFRPPPPPLAAGTYAAEPGRVAFYRATDDLLFALKVTHDGLDPAAAAMAAGLDPTAAAQAVAHAASVGLVLLPTT